MANRKSVKNRKTQESYRSILDVRKSFQSERDDQQREPEKVSERYSASASGGNSEDLMSSVESMTKRGKVVKRTPKMGGRKPHKVNLVQPPEVAEQQQIMQEYQHQILQLQTQLIDMQNRTMMTNVSQTMSLSNFAPMTSRQQLMGISRLTG